ncbi:hypothetical protein OKA05_11825 [Luteolibacter arcticus]|uniref:Uncharacterized protein n=1 Tax=Luteolibacter arcticus TaxID=1581411 RepID=A0ABT3GI91_9BACT|nr:hypothetical protein [Luteolibacter arcticus]MCW1923243.1 hypothetical protein [Luteolibacter arcticus]
MALLVCFHEACSEVDWSKKVIYLDQRFYELLFDYCKEPESDSPLKAMVSIGYDDEIILTGTQVSETLSDLERIYAAGKVIHPQVPLLCEVLREAVSRRCELAVAGDMHPDLSRG